MRIKRDIYFPIVIIKECKLFFECLAFLHSQRKKKHVKLPESN